MHHKNMKKKDLSQSATQKQKNVSLSSSASSKMSGEKSQELSLRDVLNDLKEKSTMQLFFCS